jgi:hypothetical protein
MNLRYRAALALMLLTGCGTGLSYRPPQSTGWQIMQPPQIEGQPYPTPDEAAPLSKWVVAPADIDVYPSQNECEQILENWRVASRREGFPQFSSLHRMSRCVSIDDPRLKGS